jgi:hypothetical protein
MTAVLLEGINVQVVHPRTGVPTQYTANRASHALIYSKVNHRFEF